MNTADLTFQFNSFLPLFVYRSQDAPERAAHQRKYKSKGFGSGKLTGERGRAEGPGAYDFSTDATEERTGDLEGQTHITADGGGGRVDRD